MATIRKRQSGKWQVIIRKKNYPSVVRSFLEKSTATKFAKDVETQMDKQIFQDLTGASTTTLKELMIKYRDEIVPTQKAHRSTTATLNMLMKHRIAFYSLTQLKSVHLYKLKKEMSVGRAPKTVNGYIQLLSLIWKTAKRVWSISLPAESPAYISLEEKKDILKSIPVSPLVKKKKIKRTLVVEKPKPEPKPPIINLLELEDWLNELDKNWWEEEHEPAPWDEKVLLQVPRSQLKGISSIMNLHKKLA